MTTQLKENVQELLNVVAEVTSGEGSIVSTGVKGRYAGSEKCRFTLNCTAFTGTAMAVDVVMTVAGVDIIVASFTDVAAIVQESITVDICPINVKIVYTENAVTDFDCTVHSIRF